MVVVPFWEHTESHNVLFLFLSPYPHQERKPKGNQGALQEDHCSYRSAIILSLWPIQVRFRLLFTTWLSLWVWDIVWVYDWLLESILGSYSAFMLTFHTPYYHHFNPSPYPIIYLFFLISIHVFFLFFMLSSSWESHINLRVFLYIFIW